jgi:hypothetical protein
MNRLIFGGSLASALFLIIGTYVFPSSDMMWLASTSLAYTVVRCAMVAVLLVVLFTDPPRKIAVRLLMGAAAATLVGWGSALIASDSMHVLDVVLFLEVGFAFGLEALELNEEEVEERIDYLQHPEAAPAVKTLGSLVAAYWQRLQMHHQLEWRTV